MRLIVIPVNFKNIVWSISDYIAIFWVRFGCVFKYKMSDEAFEIRERINKSQLSIYSDLSKNNELYLDDSNLKFLIEKYLIGENFSDLPLRTRSKRVKTLICSSMGYEIPK